MYSSKTFNINICVYICVYNIYITISQKVWTDVRMVSFPQFCVQQNQINSYHIIHCEMRFRYNYLDSAQVVGRVIILHKVLTEFSLDLRETCHVYAESPRTGSNHLRFWKLFPEKKVDVIISPLMEITDTIISETRQAVCILFAEIKPGISTDNNLSQTGYITMTSYSFL